MPELLNSAIVAQTARIPSSSHKKSFDKQDYYDYLKTPEWQQKRRLGFMLTGYRCTLFPWLKATNYHHMSYRNLYHELPWRDCVPLSEFAHLKVVHLGKKGLPKITPLFNLILRFLFPIVVIIGLVFSRSSKKIKIKKTL